MKIIYMGTPEFAVAPLEALLKEGFEIAAVVTAPDKPAGRGKKLQSPPVKTCALEHGLTVLQPEKLKDPVFLEKLRSFHADLQIVVAFRMLPEEVWAMPPRGTFNLHASLLPQYRGAAPINHVIINGEKETGLTTFFIDKEIDTGRIILQRKMAIDPGLTAGELHDRMMAEGARLVVDTARMIAEGRAEAVSQESIAGNTGPLKTAPKIFPEDTLIDWSAGARQICDFIRGLSPYPGARAILQKENGEKVPLKIYYARCSGENHQLTPGTIRTDGKNQLSVAAGDGFVHITDLLQPGKKRMDVENFLRGFKDIGHCRFVGET